MVYVNRFPSIRLASSRLTVSVCVSRGGGGISHVFNGLNSVGEKYYILCSAISHSLFKMQSTNSETQHHKKSLHEGTEMIKIYFHPEIRLTLLMTLLRYESSQGIKLKIQNLIE